MHNENTVPKKAGPEIGEFYYYSFVGNEKEEDGD